MATASTSGQSAFGLGRKKKAPGLLDQIGKFFGIDKKKRGKGSFRGHLSSSPQRPQHSSSRRRGDENVVVHFFRSFVSSSPRPRSRGESRSRSPNAGAPSSEPPVNDRNTDERVRECRGGEEYDDDEEKKKKKEEEKGDGCLTDSSFEQINRLTPATIASVGHNLSS
ncbi:hypothetical protein AALO_G00259020 [Alosa alosa]|uniref:Myelin basic protein n=1 Tax=Alosa alosa TaxID=278164 RepID=A0AAV6FTQ5_9TELE|nr:hypothetical protein AALO_G00259020 [Alosa alosa]